MIPLFALALAASTVVPESASPEKTELATTFAPASPSIALPDLPDVTLADLYTPAGPAEQKPGIDSEGYYRNLYRKFTLSGGLAAYAKFSTNLQVNGSAGAGADIDMEKLLGLDESSMIARFDGRYAFNRDHWLEFSYYDIDRNGTKTIADDIQVGDVVIPAGPVHSGFDTQIFKVAYRYNFVTDPRTVIGASIGVHLMAIDTEIESESINVHERFKVNAPLPLLGLHGAYALSEKWKLSASAEFLTFDVSAYRGIISDTRLTFDHDTFENFGWGFGLNSFRVDGRIEGEGDLTSRLGYGYQGFMVYLRFLL